MQSTSLPFKLTLAALFALVISSTARTQAVPYDYEVRWPGLAGNETFAAYAFNFSVEQLGNAGGGGGGAGMARFAPAKIVKAWDDNSPSLMLECARGRHFQWVKVTMYASGKKGVGAKLQTIRFEDVLIGSFSQNAGDHALGTLGLNQQMATIYERNHQEEVGIKFRKITITNHASGNVATFTLS